MDRFADMHTFVRVVEAGSISAAAEQLNVAKSAVSRRLAELETRLGARLLNRTTRRLNLTGAGESFYQHCLRILGDLEEAEQAVCCDASTLQGTLRVAAPVTFGLVHLWPAVQAFMERYPQLLLSLDLDDRRVDLVEEGVDVALRIGNLADSSLRARRLCKIRMVLCASADYLARHGTPETPEDLLNHQSLRYSNVPESQSWQYRAADGTEGKVQVPVRLMASSGDVIRRALLAGFGVAVQPSFIVYEDIQAGRLLPLMQSYRWGMSLDAYALYPPTRYLSVRVRAFVDFLVEWFDGEPYWDDWVTDG